MVSRLVHYHQNTFDLLGIESPPRSETALAKIAECERRCGRQLPASVREWFSYEGAAPRSEPLDKGGFNYGGNGFLWSDWTNDDHPTTLEALLASFAKIRGRRDARFVHVLGENQGNGGWVVEFNGSDDPPVWCTVDWGGEPAWEEAGDDDQGTAPSHGNDGSRERRTSSSGGDADEDLDDEDLDDEDLDDEDLDDEDLDDEPYGGRLEASRFSDFVFAHFWRSHSTHVQLESRRQPGPRYDHGLWFRAPRAAAVGPEALAQISAVLGPPRVTRTASGATSYRFLDGVQSGVHLVTDEPGTPGARASWWCWAKSGPSLVALFRQVVPLGKLVRTARVETQEARKALAELLAAGALAPTRAPRPLAWSDEPSEHDDPAPEESDDPAALDRLVRSLQDDSPRAVRASLSDDEATRQLVALWHAATRPGPLVRALYKGGEDHALLRACVACARRAVALVDSPHAATLGAALDLVERAIRGEVAAGELDALEQVLSRDPAPGSHRSLRAHGSGDQEWLQLDVRYVANHCADAPLLLAQWAVVQTLRAASRVVKVETYSLDDIASGAADAAHHALLRADANAGAARAGQELAEEVRRVASPPPVAQVRAARAREKSRLDSAVKRSSARERGRG